MSQLSARRSVVSVLFLNAFLSTLCVPHLYAQKWADDMIKVKEHNFGNVSRNQKAEYEFEVYNPYLEDVRIRSVSASCSCTTVSIDKSTIKTYETAKIKARYNTDRFTGEKRATITVVIDKPFYATVQMQVKGNIRSDIVFNPSVVDFGTVPTGSATEKQVDFSYQGRSNWQVTALKSTNQSVSAELTEVSRNYGQVKYRLKVKLAPDAPAGFISDRIILIPNEGTNQEIPIMVQGVVKQGVTANPTKLYIGNVEPGQVISKKVVVRADMPFTIKQVTCKNKQYSFDFPPPARPQARTPAPSNSLYVVTVTYTAPDSQVEELFTDTISIVTDNQQAPLELQAYAKVLMVDTVEEADAEIPSDIANPTDDRQDTLSNDDVLSRLHPY